MEDVKRQASKEELIFTNPRPETGCISRVLEQLDHYKTYFKEQGSEFLQMISIVKPHKMISNIIANQENANQNSGEVLRHIY